MPTRKGLRKPKLLDPRVVLESVYKVPVPTLRTDRNGVIEHNVVTAVVDAAQAVHSFDPTSRGALVQRVRDHLRTTGDPAMVQFVLTEIVRERAENFIVLRDFTPAGFERMRVLLGIPDGAWKYALWAEGLEPGKRRTSISYWITKWADRLDVIDPTTAERDPDIARYREMLERLYSATRIEELPW